MITIFEVVLLIVIAPIEFVANFIYFVVDSIAGNTDSVIESLMMILSSLLPITIVFGVILILLKFFSEIVGNIFSRPTRRSSLRVGTLDNPRLIEKKMVEFEPKEPPKIPEPEVILREDFFCQIDNDIHPKDENAYQCQQCLRFVCESCYQVMKQQGFSKCPYCRNRLLLIKGNYCLSEPLLYKGVVLI